MKARWSVIVGLALLCRVPAHGAAADAPPITLAVVVHPSRAETPSLHEIGRIYLRQRKLWRDGSPVIPLNRQSGTPERELFSRYVLGGASARFSDYWNAAYFGGVFPPLVLMSSAAVLHYVAQEPRAIGYVAVSDLDDSVRTVLTIPPAPTHPPAPPAPEQ
jgi:ABC-type phosphate transport system substrate-binding protein